MGLDFLAVKDYAGSAFYVIYDGSARQQKHWQDFFDTLDDNVKHQTYLFDIKNKDGENLRSFYGFATNQLPVAFIVRDDDQIAYQWVGSELVTTEHVSALLKQESNT